MPKPLLLLLTLASSAPDGSPRPPPPPVVDLELQDADIRDVLRTLAEVGRINIVVAPDVSGRVSGRFQRVPWDEALHQILCSLQLTMERDGNVIFVEKA